MEKNTYELQVASYGLRIDPLGFEPEIKIEDRWIMELRRQRRNLYNMMLLTCIINDFFQFRLN